MDNINPSTTAILSRTDKLVFKCPTCPANITVSLAQIDRIAGANVLCTGCKNIVHVPGAYGSNAKSVGLKITGGVTVTIADFNEWWGNHRLVASLLKDGELDLLYDYGLWAFCEKCYHRYHPYAVFCLPVGQRATSTKISTELMPESGRDLEALLSGYCPSCHHSRFIVIVAEIPDYVRTTIIKRRGIVTGNKTNLTEKILSVKKLFSKKP